jgi:hypothetical protein
MTAPDTPTADFVPRVVRNFADRFTPFLPEPPEVEQIPDTLRWRVWVENDRVYADATFEMTGRANRCHQTGATLTVDGVAVPKERHAQNGEHLARILADPDTQLDKPHADRPAGDAPLDVHDLAGTPAAVYKAYTKMAAKSPTAVLTVGRIGPSWWAIRIGSTDTPDTYVTVLFEHNHHANDWRMSRRHMFTVVTAGVDRTDELDGNLERAMRMVTPTTKQVASPPITGPARSTRDRGVEVRRQAVRRV